MSDFSFALSEIKSGNMVRRVGWNGKGMHVYLEEHLRFLVKPTKSTRGIDREYEPVLCLFTAQGRHQPGWLPSQQDLLANDWEVVRE